MVFERPWEHCYSSLPGPSCKSATGLMEWADIDMALDAFVLGNHQTLFAKSMLCPRIAVGNLVSFSFFVYVFLLSILRLSLPLPPFWCTGDSWVCCVALPCCLFDLACFFLPSFSSLIKTCIYPPSVYLTSFSSPLLFIQMGKPTHSRWRSLPIHLLSMEGEGEAAVVV